MEQPRHMRHPVTGEHIVGMEMDLRKFEQFKPTVEQVREMILNLWITAPDWGLCFDLDKQAELYRVPQREIDLTGELAIEAVRYGRFIDFGMLPNDVIKHGGDRGGPMWNAAAIGQPFSEPWIMMHAWEGGVAIYLVNPRNDRWFEACELQPMRYREGKLLLICDRALFQTVEGMLPSKKYLCNVAPSPLRYIRDPEARAAMNNNGAPEGAAAANVGDPVMAALLILSTRNVDRQTVVADAKLQKARARTGKPPIPPYDRVNAVPYVTAIMARGKPSARGEDRGGHHASPVPHLRIGHPRHYADGRTIFIKDTLVNVNDEQRAEFLRTRSHYEVKP